MSAKYRMTPARRAALQRRHEATLRHVVVEHLPALEAQYLAPGATADDICRYVRREHSHFTVDDLSKAYSLAVREWDSIYRSLRQEERDSLFWRAFPVREYGSAREHMRIMDSIYNALHTPQRIGCAKDTPSPQLDKFERFRKKSGDGRRVLKALPK